MSKDPNAVALGKKGGTARGKSLSREQRVAASMKAVQARWGSKLLTEEDREVIRGLRKQGWTYRSIAEAQGVSHSTVVKVCRVLYEGGQ